MQAFNPYLPLDVYIPDGEPHVFGDRIYVYGSHDKANGDSFCLLDYEIYSAPLNDLGNWTSRGISYSGMQDPTATKMRNDLYAPDAVRGNDGRYYLYYCLSGHAGKGGYDGPIGVAVSDQPDGRFEFYGHVHYPDGRVLRDFVPFDPAVINDDGVIRLYYGTCFDFVERYTPESSHYGRTIEAGIFNKSEEEVEKQEETFMGAVCCTLDEDMVTVKTRPKRIMPARTAGTSFEGHGFFEAGSIRKINDTYYFIYSSQNCHELCYATSHWPDRDFHYRGIIISNGDVGLNGRRAEDALNAVGNNHGSIERIGTQWYVFYHRQTNKSSYSRQGCAEPIEILADGTIRQAEMTSCGLNGRALDAEGTYPAAICCNLTNGKMPVGVNGFIDTDIPYIANQCGKVVIDGIRDGTMVGYKYFCFKGAVPFCIRAKGGSGCFEIRTSSDGDIAACIPVENTLDWKWYRTLLNVPAGDHPLFLTYRGVEKQMLSDIGFAVQDFL